jgi:hypothetical protein
MEKTPGLSRLPFAKQEIALARDVFMSMSIVPVEPVPIQEAIMSELLESCEIFHFAGHAQSDRFDALESHIFLGDKHYQDKESDLLKARDLLKINIRERAPFLAYLSACGTGRNNEAKSMDESIHLITAFQMAGFRHTIGTLWEVNDETCADMAKITYQGIRDGGMTDESVCRGLHNACRALRDRWLRISITHRAEGLATGRSRLKGKEPSGVGIADPMSPLSRDVTSWEDEGTESAHWVPYVHFGV